MRRLAILLLLSSGMVSCASSGTIGDRFVGELDSLRRHAGEFVADIAESSGQLQRTAIELSDVPGDISNRLSAIPVRMREMLRDLEQVATRTPRATTSALAAAIDDSVRRARRLTLTKTYLPHRDTLDAELARRRLAFSKAIRTFRLDRSPFPHATDPSRILTVEPTVPRASWLERMLDRIPF